MAEKNNGARRRKAFADFKENQYDDAFSLSASQKKKKTASRIVRWVLLVLITAVCIVIGFVITDALLDISQQPYQDPNTYTPAYVNTTTTITTTTSQSTSDEENTDGITDDDADENTEPAASTYAEETEEPQTADDETIIN